MSKKRLVKDRPVTSITLGIPVDVVDSLKEIVPLIEALRKHGVPAALLDDAAKELASA